MQPAHASPWLRSTDGLGKEGERGPDESAP
jgi:hypothetical protein